MRSPTLAALLSFVWPGLGQLYLGKRRAAAILALPAVLVTLVVVYQLWQGPVAFAVSLFAERSLGLAAVVIVVLVGILRLAAVAHAYLSGEPSKAAKPLNRLAAAVLVAVIVASHATAGYYLLVYSNAGAQVFNPNSSLIDDSGAGSTASLAPGQTPYPSAEVIPATPPPPGSRVTILFTGVDSDPTRSEHLYDSIMVVSYDPKTNSVQMVSVPRDSASFPLYFGGQVPVTTRINAVPTYVRNGWIKSPDSPYMTLVKEIGYLVGLPINYYAVMDLGGFVKMIDKVGGIDVVNPSVINDGVYDWMNGKPLGFYLPAGPAHLDGIHALAYVRSRHGAENSDWARASRQQQVLVDLLHKMAQPSQILALPDLISTVGSSVATNFPADQLADFVTKGQAVPSGNFKQVVLGPPYTLTNVNNVNSASTTCLINAKVAALSVQWFGSDSTWFGKPAPANTCP